MDMQFSSPSSAAALQALAAMRSASGLSSDALKSFLNAMPVPLTLLSLEDGTTTLLNRAFCEAYGCKQNNARTSTELAQQFVDPVQRDIIAQRWNTQVALSRLAGDASLQIEEMELVLRGGDEREYTVLHSGFLFPALGCAVGIYLDLTARKARELRLAESEQQARQREILYPVLLELTQEMIVLTDMHGKRTFVTPTVLPLTGWTQEEYLATTTDQSVHEEDLARVREVRSRCLTGSKKERIRYRTIKKDGSWLWLEATAACYRDPLTQEPLGYVSTMRDGTDEQLEEAKRQEREALLQEQARYDHLTRVANRHVFYTALNAEARRQTRRDPSLSLLLLDIDHFKLFNDRYGHLEGDNVLRKVADILKTAASRIADLVARFGGEEFVLLLPMTDRSGAICIAENILAALRIAAIPHEDSPSGVLSVSIGIATSPGNTTLDQDQLLLTADKALYIAKRQGRDRYAMVPDPTLECLEAAV